MDTLERQLAGLQAPSVIRLRAAPLGDIDASTLFSDKVQRLVNGVLVEERVPQHRGTRLRDLFDALLYLGPRLAMTRTVDTPEQLADTAFVRELDRRSRLQFGRAFRPTTAAERRFYP